MTDRVSVGNLRIARVLYDFVNNEALPGTDIDPDSFWAGVDKVVTDLTPQNQDLLNRRDELQAQIDKWHRQRVIEPLDMDAYRQFLTEIGYLQPEPDDFTITTSGVDDEITRPCRPAAGGAGAQCAVRAERGQRSLGLSLRRALRHRRHPGKGRRRTGLRLQQGARRQGDRLRAQVPRRGRAAVVGFVGRRDRFRASRTASCWSLCGEESTGLASPEPSSPGTRGEAELAHGRSCWSTTVCTSRS